MLIVGIMHRPQGHRGRGRPHHYQPRHYHGDYSSWQPRAPSPERFSGHQWTVIPEIKESDHIPHAIERAAEYIERLQARIKEVEARTAMIQKIDTEIFTSVSHYESYQKSQRDNEEITARIAAKKRAEEEARAKVIARNQEHFDGLLEQIKQNWEEYFACATSGYDDVETIEFLNSFYTKYEYALLAANIHNTTDLSQDINLRPVQALWDHMAMYIRKIHEMHNCVLIQRLKDSGQTFRCPVRGCYAMTPLQHRCASEECQTKIIWNTSDVDYLKEPKISATFPAGYLDRF